MHDYLDAISDVSHQLKKNVNKQLAKCKQTPQNGGFIDILSAVCLHFFSDDFLKIKIPLLVHFETQKLL